MHVNTIIIAATGISSGMGTLIYNKAFITAPICFMSKYRTAKSCTNN